MSWRTAAACKGKGKLFFPVQPGTSYRVRDYDPYEQARTICAGCPVSGPCLDYALSLGRKGQQVDGMYGGKDEHERRAILGRKLPARRAS